MDVSEISFFTELEDLSGLFSEVPEDTTDSVEASFLKALQDPGEDLQAFTKLCGSQTEADLDRLLEAILYGDLDHAAAPVEGQVQDEPQIQEPDCPPSPMSDPQSSDEMFVPLDTHACPPSFIPLCSRVQTSVFVPPFTLLRPPIFVHTHTPVQQTVPAPVYSPAYQILSVPLQTPVQQTVSLPVYTPVQPTAPVPVCTPTRPPAHVSPCSLTRTKPYIKKPPNAFMIFRKEQRPHVVAQLQAPDCATVNKVLGQMWHSLSAEQEQKYHEEQRKESQRHYELHPTWTPQKKVKNVKSSQ